MEQWKSKNSIAVKQIRTIVEESASDTKGVRKNKETTPACIQYGTQDRLLVGISVEKISG